MLCATHGHGRTDAELTGGIRTGGDHAALIGLTADSKGFSLQGRVMQFFDGAKEGIQIEVKDFSGHKEIIQQAVKGRKYYDVNSAEPENFTLLYQMRKIIIPDAL
jgi:hypothetical protein